MLERRAMIDYAKVRRMMVDNQLRTYVISDLGVLSGPNFLMNEVLARDLSLRQIWRCLRIRIVRWSSRAARKARRATSWRRWSFCPQLQKSGSAPKASAS